MLGRFQRRSLFVCLLNNLMERPRGPSLPKQKAAQSALTLTKRLSKPAH
jgi:hypothetical protein